MEQQSDLTYIKIPFPDAAQDLHLKILAPTNALVIAPGLGNAWVNGRYNDPKSVIPLHITQTENSVLISVVGAFGYRTPPAYLPDMRLSFGRLHPFALSILAGDVPDHLDLGGIPLSSLEIKFGAGQQVLDFSSPNPQEMSHLKVEADSGAVQIEHLANANAAEVKLNGDATHYRINLGGELKQNIHLQLGMSLARTEVFITSGTAVKIKSGTAPGGSQAEDFSYADKMYWNTPARSHQEPVLNIHNIAAAQLKINYS
jgi:hypothetical protein